MYGFMNGMASMRYGAMTMGIILILLGWLIFAVPNLLEYIIAGVFVFAGISMVMFGWNMRGTVRYQQIGRSDPRDTDEF